VLHLRRVRFVVCDNERCHYGWAALDGMSETQPHGGFSGSRLCRKIVSVESCSSLGGVASLSLIELGDMQLRV
jgi:hypothetical protein